MFCYTKNLWQIQKYELFKIGNQCQWCSRCGCRTFPFYVINLLVLLFYPWKWWFTSEINISILRHWQGLTLSSAGMITLGRHRFTGPNPVEIKKKTNTVKWCPLKYRVYLILCFKQFYVDTLTKHHYKYLNITCIYTYTGSRILLFQSDFTETFTFFEIRCFLLEVKTTPLNQHWLFENDTDMCMLQWEWESDNFIV
jgi:hypothetical protein